MLAEYERAFKAAADGTRARMLKLLEGGELCVCQIIAVMGLGQATVSKHLSLMRAAGLLQERKQGRWVHYALARFRPAAAGPDGHLRKLLRLASQWLDDDSVIAADRKRLAKVCALSPEELCARGLYRRSPAVGGRGRRAPPGPKLAKR